MVDSFNDNSRAIIIGASGGIGTALVAHLAKSDCFCEIHALSRSGKVFDSGKVTSHRFDLTREHDLESESRNLKETGDFDLVVVAAGFLHSGTLGPEKNLRALSFEGFKTNFAINTIGPAMGAKYFLPLLGRESKSVFAALSARVGSISDNRLGGWYAYRASKAALNMVIKTLSIETARRSAYPIVIGLHPGTVDTPLSEPFQGHVAESKLFTPEYSAGKLLDVIDRVKPERNGELIAWDNETVPF
ncbi:MAG: SDR family NAD(P)-dependent oxidoreductase [Hyphomonadaceae bacterium]|nr:SDR family NAD(P)-dependent oxidoreductase [Hyphomonadaceae bacterium]MBC6411561.1 SDR family NAD(P)-dependent oxidoreductase [Hyphomonadaceae bacterium]